MWILFIKKLQIRVEIPGRWRGVPRGRRRGRRGWKGGIFGLRPVLGVSYQTPGIPILFPSPIILIFWMFIVCCYCYYFVLLFCIASATCPPAGVRSLLSDTRNSNPSLTSPHLFFLDYMNAYCLFFVYWLLFITHYFDCLYVYSLGLRPDALHLLIIWMFIAFEASSYQKYPKVSKAPLSLLLLGLCLPRRMIFFQWLKYF